MQHASVIDPLLDGLRDHYLVAEACLLGVAEFGRPGKIISDIDWEIPMVEDIVICLLGLYMIATAIHTGTNVVAIYDESIIVVPPSLLNAWNKSRNHALRVGVLSAYLHLGYLSFPCCALVCEHACG